MVAVRGVCEPADIIANRLDPWHGTWYHPYAFSHLTVDDAASSDDRLVVDVAFRLSRTWGVPVRAEFACPDARTIVMTIVEGEGAGSVVETHATLIGRRPVRTSADRHDRGDHRALRPPGLRRRPRGRAALRPAVASTARQLWVDDMAYAERRWLLRDRGETYGV